MDQVLLASQAATMLVCLIAIITLIFTACNTRANAGTQKARFLLGLRNHFMDKHKTAAEKVSKATYPDNYLKPDIEGNPPDQDGAAKLTAADPDHDMSLYMGTLELCEVMLEDGLFDVATFFDAHGYRVEQLAAQPALMDTVLLPAGRHCWTASEYWGKFVKLLWRVHKERKRRKLPALNIGGVSAATRIPPAYRV
jgi:hypothetical protein